MAVKMKGKSTLEKVTKVTRRKPTVKAGTNKRLASRKRAGKRGYCFAEGSRGGSSGAPSLADPSLTSEPSSPPGAPFCLDVGCEAGSKGSSSFITQGVSRKAGEGEECFWTRPRNSSKQT